MRIQTACLIAAINGSLTPNNYKLLSEWLDGYEYVNPDDRKLNPTLSLKLSASVAKLSATPTDYFSLWIALDILYHNASQEIQQEILYWMVQNGYGHTA